MDGVTDGVQPVQMEDSAVDNTNASVSPSLKPAAGAGSPWDQPGLGCPALLLLPIAVVGFLLNALSVTELVTERASCTRHYALLASLAACDALDALCCVPLALAKSYIGNYTLIKRIHLYFELQRKVKICPCFCGFALSSVAFVR